MTGGGASNALPRRVRPVRLVRTADYARVQSVARRVRGSFLLLLVASSGPDAALPRIGLTVSRKVGNAVTRNRVKRWLREAVRAVGAPPLSLDVVVVARPEAARAGFAALRDDLDATLARIRA